MSIFGRVNNIFLIFVPAALIGIFIAYLAASTSDPATDEQLNAQVVPENVEQWKSLIDVIGGDEAYALFASAHADTSVNLAHERAHEFGEALYKSEGIDGIAVCDTQYSFGCYHSFFGWALIDNGLSIITDLDKACISRYGVTGLACQHGIGHGILAELGPEKLTEALDACDTLYWQGPIGGCKGGAFMEYNFSTMSTAVNRSFSPEQPYYPCTEIEAGHQQACYFTQAAWWVHHANVSFPDAGMLCQGVTGEENRHMCYRGLGDIAAGDFGLDIEFAIDVCSQMPSEEGINTCAQGTARMFFAVEETSHRWQEVCEPLSPAGRKQCLLNINFL